MASTQYAKKIAQLEQLINGSVKSVTTDGVTTQFDLDLARARLAELKRLQGDSNAKNKISTLNLRNCW